MHSTCIPLIILLIALSIDASGLRSLPLDCGKVKSRTNKISGGRPAKRGQFPSYTYIQIFSGRLLMNCGGTLISNRHVITAAHCVYNRENDRDYNNFLLYPGFHDIPKDLTNYRELKYFRRAYKNEKVCRSRKYPALDKFGKTNYDLAVIKLNETLGFDKSLQPACLKPHKSKLLDSLNGENSPFAIGMGARKTDRFFTNLILDEPRVLQVLPVRQEKCDEVDQNRTKVCFKSWKPDQVGDTCIGDSGGGIFEFSNGRSHLVALTSYGPAVCETGVSSKSVNTNIVELEREIDELLQECA